MNKTNSYSSASGSCHIGFDIGSVSLNTVVLSDNNEIIEDYYDYIHGKPFNVLKERLTSLLERSCRKHSRCSYYRFRRQIGK